MNRALQIHSARKRIRAGLACCTALLLVLLTACGQKGPLFLPEESETSSAATEQATENGQPSVPNDENGDENGDEDGSDR